LTYVNYDSALKIQNDYDGTVYNSNAPSIEAQDKAASSKEEKSKSTVEFEDFK